MAETPVRRGPGRPRKVVPDAPAVDAKADEPPKESPAEKARPSDDRIGEEVDPAVEFLSFEDGREYRCADGVITERVT